jgi:hypothetical protein
MNEAVTGAVIYIPMRFSFSALGWMLGRAFKKFKMRHYPGNGKSLSMGGRRGAPVGLSSHP